MAAPKRDDWVLFNPRGLLRREMRAPDTVMRNAAGEQLASHHLAEPTAIPQNLAGSARTVLLTPVQYGPPDAQFAVGGNVLV